jgi:glycosyltransferase involved in cell wall biosynthesis
VRAAEIVRKQRSDVKFQIVGEDRSRDGRNEKDLRDLIAHLDLSGTVELSGWSNNIADVLGGFDIFVSASRSESFGFVIAEAMLTGVPVVATRTEGAQEIISDSSLGLLVPIGSPDSLAAAILDLLSDDKKRRELTKYGREHVSNNFSLKRMVDETEAIYRRAIAGG